MTTRGRGPAPREDTKPRPGQAGWAYAEGDCWVGPVPKPPPGLRPASRQAWATWFAAWFSWFWSADDLPVLRLMVKLYDAVERGQLTRHGELRLALEAMGVTPRGQMGLRRRPRREPTTVVVSGGVVARGRRYGHLTAAPELVQDVDDVG